MADEIRLLFVDDEPGIRLTLPSILQMHGFSVVAAATVREALERIQSQPFDILLSDLNIGEPGDGFTVVSAMRRMQPDARTFIITGYPDFETALQAIRSQVDDYFVKPANIPNLVKSLRDKAHEKRTAPLQSKSVPALLREKKDQIIEDWLQQVEADPELKTVSLDRQARINHAPVLLDELCRCLESRHHCLSQPGVEAAANHGRVRYAQRYTIPMVASEARLMENCIAEHLQCNLLVLDLSSLITDTFLIADCFNLMLMDSIRAFQEHSESPVAA
jgi:ActR/RegA family two-component response regulator